MIAFTTTIKRFENKGEKTGWTYLLFSAKQAAAINPGVKTSFRVKGTLDHFAIEKLAVLPMGDGDFILPLNAAIRKGIKKEKGAQLSVRLELDTEPIQLDADLLECLQDDPIALKNFQTLTKGHQNYFSKWIESAKTDATKAKRIAMAVSALGKGLGFPEMLRAQKAAKELKGL